MESYWVLWLYVVRGGKVSRISNHLFRYTMTAILLLFFISYVIGTCWLVCCYPQRIFADTLVDNKDDFLQTFSTESHFARCFVMVILCTSNSSFYLVLALLFDLWFLYFKCLQIHYLRWRDIATQNLQWTCWF
jgi:hypothetical protein